MKTGLNVRARALLWLAAFVFVLSQAGGPLAAHAAQPAMDGQLITVVVQPGDNLAKYTRIYGVSGGRLRSANPQLSDPNLIRPGSTITIPVIHTSTPSLTTPFYYTVQAGDRLSALGERFEMDYSLIASTNNLASDVVVVGQTLLIPAGPHRYYAQRGDTMRSVAARYGTTVQFLLTGNNLPNPDLIFVGQPIFIPIIYDALPRPIPGATVPPPAATATPGPAPTTGAPPAGNFIQVTVRSGENFTTYVRRYGVTPAALRVANANILDPNIIRPGDIVIVPVPVSFTPSRTTPFFHVVAAGQTSTSLAARYEMAAGTLTGANPGANFAVGSTILVPAGPHLYTVRTGDTMAIIARRYATTVDVLLTGNNLPNANNIFPGQQIFIPLQIGKQPVAFD